MPVFHLDGQPVEFEPGEKVLSAALRAGVEVPHYCFHPGLSVVATCRMCLVDVVDMGNGRPMPPQCRQGYAAVPLITCIT